MTNKIIRNHNDPNNAITPNGRTVQREKAIFLPSYRSFLPVLQTLMHFIFRDPDVPRGTTLFCTCGAVGIIVGYEAYQKHSSFMGNEVISCHNFIQYGVHADGSHE